MKSLFLLVLGVTLIAAGLRQMGAWGIGAVLLLVAGGAMALWGLVANHRDHTRR